MTAYTGGSTSTIGALTLSGPMTVTVNASDGSLIATDVVVEGGANVTNNRALTIDSGVAATNANYHSLTVTGNGSKYTNTAGIGLAATGTGTANVTVADQGELAANITVTKGTLTINNATVTGNVTLNGTATSDANVVVAGGTNEAKLIVLGGTAESSVITDDNKIQLNNLGSVEMQYAAVVDNTGKAAVTGVGTIDANSTTGALILKDGSASLSLADYKTLKSDLLSSGGTLRLDGVQIQAKAEENIGDIAGISVPNTVAIITSGGNTAVGGTEVKGLKLDNSGASSFTVTGTGASLALVGEAGNQNFQLVNNVNAGAAATTLTAASKGTLALGQQWRLRRRRHHHRQYHRR